MLIQHLKNGIKFEIKIYSTTARFGQKSDILEVIVQIHNLEDYYDRSHSKITMVDPIVKLMS